MVVTFLPSKCLFHVNFMLQKGLQNYSKFTTVFCRRLLFLLRSASSSVNWSTPSPRQGPKILQIKMTDPEFFVTQERIRIMPHLHIWVENTTSELWIRLLPCQTVFLGCFENDNQELLSLIYFAPRHCQSMLSHT